jgi:prepilin-type N-terminal cleavage/methylation domain-containing protein
MVTRAGRRPTRRPSRRLRAGEAGLTLIEMVVTLAIISIGVVGIAYGFSAAVRGAGDAQVQAELDAAAQAAATYVQSVLPYCPCDNCAGGTYSLNGLPMPPHVTAWSLASVTESQPSPNPGFSGTTCQAGVDYGVQEITVTVSDGSNSMSRVVWKGDPS